MVGEGIVIDPEFQAAIPPPREEEREQLEANILADGAIREPVVCWPNAGKRILVDGHNRFAIAKTHNLKLPVVEKQFENREQAADWIDANQLGRRNLTPDQSSLLRGRRYNRTKRQGKRNDLTSDQNDTKSSSGAEKLAKQHGVSAPTIKRDAQFARAVDKVKSVDPQIEKKVTAGTAPPKAAVVKAAKLLDSSPEKASAILQGSKRLVEVVREEKEEKREARRESNRAIIAKTPEPAAATTAGAKFATIVIDPPWDWGDEGDADQLGRARPTYGTMSFEELKALKVGKLADDDCHIYLWITNRSLPKGFALLDAWGFRYVTCLTWCKPSIGMGNYFRGSTEQILFGVKGSQPLKRKNVGTWFAAPRGPKGHSSKPIEFYDLVESCSPGPFIEMFARSNRPGWIAWGAEAK